MIKLRKFIVFSKFRLYDQLEIIDISIDLAITSIYNEFKEHR